MALIPSGLDFESTLEKRRNSEPARSYLWHVVLPDLNESPIGVTNAVEEASKRWQSGVNRNIDMELLNTLVTDISTPYFEFDTDKITNGSTFWYEAKHNDISNITMTIEEQESGIVYQYLKNWSDLIVNSDGTYNPPFFYKRPIRFYLLNIAKFEFQVFEYKDYFVSEVSARSNTYGNTEAVTYDVSFTGDSLENVTTVNGSQLSSVLESTSLQLDVEIPYSRFDFSGISSPTVANVMNDMARRII